VVVSRRNRGDTGVGPSSYKQLQHVIYSDTEQTSTRLYIFAESNPDV